MLKLIGLLALKVIKETSLGFKKAQEYIVEHLPRDQDCFAINHFDKANETSSSFHLQVQAIIVL